MAAPMMQVPDESWRTTNFRQNMVSKIEEAILNCGTPTSKNAADMEIQVYSKANSKNEYLSFVARLILHIKEMGKPKALPGQAQVGNPMTHQMNSLNSNGQMNQGMGQGMGQQQHGQGMSMNQPGGGMNNPQQSQSGITMQQQTGNMNMSQSGMVGQVGAMMGQQQQQQGQNTSMMGQQGQSGGMMGQSGPGGMMGQVRLMSSSQVSNGGMIGQPGSMMQQGGGGMNVNMAQQNQMLNQNQNFLNPQQMQMQNNNLGNQGQMQGSPGMNNPQMQQVLLQQQQNEQQQGGVRMRMPMQHNMPRKVLQTRPMNPMAMGIHRPEHGPNYSMNRVSYYGSPQGDGAGMQNQFGGGPQQSSMQRPGVPFMPPNSSPGMPMGSGPTPSPNSMNQGQNQSNYAHSPQSLHPHGSPAPPGGIRSFGNQMIPSPSPSTPMQMQTTQSPRNPEELACMKKIEELRKYTDMIQRMIVKIGNEDTEKSSKMKKLLDILLNPNRQVSMELLLKCEIALKKMEKQQHETGPLSQPTVPPKDQISPFLQLQEAILTTLKNSSSSHTFLRTFRPSIEALTGQSAVCPDSSDDMEAALNDVPKPEIPVVLTRELRLMGRRFPVTIQQQGRNLPLIIRANIGDPKLPRVPMLKVIIPLNYPDESPSLIDFQKDYSTTTFLSSVAQAFKSRMVILPTKFTLYELLVSWEMTIRQVSNPNGKKKLKRLSEPPAPTMTARRLALSFM